MRNRKLLKKVTASIVCSAMAITAFCGLTACKDVEGENPDGHVHSYSWVDDKNGETHHEHCGVDGCDAPDKAPENHMWSGDECNKCHAVKAGFKDNAIIPEFTGAGAGPVAGEQVMSVNFNAKNLPNGAISASDPWSDGTYTVSGEVMAKADKSGKYSHSVKNGVVKVNVPASGKLTVYFANGSSDKVSQLTIKKPDGTTEAVDTEKGNAQVLIAKEIDVVAGEYTFSKSANTIYLFACELSYNISATPIQSIEIANAGTTDYLVTQKVDCTGITVVAKDTSGSPHAVKLANCKFDASKYNPNASGEYEIGVTYYLTDNLDSATTEFSTTYKVKVYTVDSIALETVGLNSKGQVTLQQAYLTGGSFTSANLAVVATCKFGNSTISQKLKDSWYTVSTPTLTAEGEQTVTVSVNSDYTVDNKAVSATYTVAVKAKKEVTDNKVEITVGETGEFKTLTQAVQYLKACNYESGVNKIIKLQTGTYTEKVWLDLDNVTIAGTGENIDDTTLTYSLVEGDADALSGSLWGLNCATLHVTGKNFKAYNLAIRNDFDYIKNSGKYSGTQSCQGVALTIDNKDNNVIYKCHIYGNQDTLYMKSGRTYYYQTQIDGNIDFIFGNETGLAYFEDCTVMAISKTAEGKEQNGYVTAPQHKEATKPDYGYIFDGCHFTSDGIVKEGSMSLGRPWGPKATVAYINCDFSSAYSTLASDASGKDHRWNAMSGNNPEDADFCEYGSTGAGAITEAVKGGKVLTEAQALNYTKANIFGTANGKVGYTTAFECDGEYAKLRILVGLDDGEIPEQTTITIDLQDVALAGNCTDIINEKYGDKITWSGTANQEAEKPENGVKIGTDTVISVNVVGEVSLVAGYQLPASDYIITYSEGKATIRFIGITGTYGDYIGSIIIDTAKVPEDTQTVNVTVDYNDDGATANGTLTAVAGAPLAKPADPVREGYTFLGWQVAGADYNFTEPVTEAFTLVAQWEVANDYDLTAGGSVNLYEFTTGQVQGSTATYRGIIIEVSAEQKFAPRADYRDVQINATETAPVKIKFKVNDGTTAENITVSFTAQAGSQYIPVFTVDVETADSVTYAVVSITSNSYPSTMTVTIA